MADRNKLSIYLIKDRFASDDNQILKKEKELITEIDGVGKVYYSPSQTTKPAWLDSFFRGKLDGVDIFSSNARAILLTRIETKEGIIKTFAITMGYGKYLLADDVIEEDFGLKVVLNTITPNSLRKINKINIGGNQKISNEQLPLESEITDFGFDVEQDLICTITGYSDDGSFTTGIMTGADLLSLTAEVDINNLRSFLEHAYMRYCSDGYKQHFPWIDQIKRVKDSSTIQSLDCKVVDLINLGSPKVWMAVPEVVQWECIAGFRYNGKELYDDIYIDKVKESFRNGLTNISQLKNKQIRAILAEASVEVPNEDLESSEAIYGKWSAYKCLYGDIELNGQVYCINNGKWFQVERDFVTSINNEYNSIPISPIAFLPHASTHRTENEYTVAFVNWKPKELLCMDAKTIVYGGGRSKIELCDVLTTDGTYIHLKPYSGSSTLSHLFNQAVISAELVLSDPTFVIEANKKIKKETKNTAFLIDPSKNKPAIVFAIISKHSGDHPDIPFFSKVALRYAKRRLAMDGCKVYIKNIQKA